MTRATITVPAGSDVFVLDDDGERVEWFLENVPDATVARTAAEAIARLVEHGPFDIAFLDHDLGATAEDGVRQQGCVVGPGASGYKVAKHLAENPGIAEVIVIHSWNPDGARQMNNVLDGGAIVIPFGQFHISRR